MKRKITERRQSPVRPSDVRRDLTKETLAGIGAIALAWNDVEAMLDVLLCLCIDIHANTWRELASRINGIDGKIALIRFAFSNMYRESYTDLIRYLEDTFSGAMQYKGYRDTIIHARVIDVNLGIAEMIFRRDRMEEVLITEDALNKLYDKMTFLRKEILELISIVECTHTLAAVGYKDVESEGYIERLSKRHEARLGVIKEGKRGVVARDISEFARDQDIQSVGREFQDAMSRYQYYQSQRKSLPPLPSFPPLPLTPVQMEAKRQARGRRHKEGSGPEHSAGLSVIIMDRRG